MAIHDAPYAEFTLGEMQRRWVKAQELMAERGIFLVPTDFTPDLVEAAVRLLERLYRPGFHYQKCGIMLLNLSPAHQQPADLFDARDRAREAWLMRALDALNAEYGARTVRVGNHGGKRPVWAMRQAFRSLRYTTRWRELPVVR